MNRAGRAAVLIPPGDAIERIASALALRSAEVRVERWSHNERRTAVHSWGSAGGRRFFAKILVADSFPRLAPIVLPTDALQGERTDTCTAEEQITTEREAGRRFARLGGLAVPALLGCAPRERVIVWEDIPGRTLDSLLRRSRYTPAAGRDLACGLQRVGIWARRLHDVSTSGRIDVDLGALATTLERYADSIGPERRRYVRVAITLIEDARRAIGAESMSVPTAFTHGDLSPPNLLWDSALAEGAVVDFEHSQVRPAIHDLVLLLANLRTKLLNPLVPGSVIVRGDEAFWNGYGPVGKETRLLVESLASAWVFFRFLPALSRRAGQQGSFRRVVTAFYQATLESMRTRSALQNLRRRFAVLQ